VQQAIKDKRVTEGMNHEQVIMAMGRPAHKSRETKDGIEEEDWVYERRRPDHLRHLQRRQSDQGKGILRRPGTKWPTRR